MSRQNYPPLHLSVARNGVVSLWDHKIDVPGETYVRLELSLAQLNALNAAARLATENN